MARFISLLLLLFSMPVAFATERVTFSVTQIKIQGWQLQGVKISLLTPFKKSPQFQLAITQLFLPKPFDDLKLLHVKCSQFKWGNNEIHCLQGKTQLQSTLFNSPQFDFSFHITQKQSQFQIQPFKLLEGKFDLKGNANATDWQLSLNGKQIGLTVLHNLLFPKLKLSSGHVNFAGKAQGNHHGLKKVNLQVQSDNLSIQTIEGTKATEALTLNLNLNAIKKQPELWLWEINNLFPHGNFYIDPLYFENKNSAISLQAHGYWDEASQKLEINSAKFNHPMLCFMTAHGVINRKPNLSLEQATIYLNILDLKTASTIYLAPFVSGTALENLLFLGQLEAGVQLKNQALSEAYLVSNTLVVQDKNKQFDLKDSVISLNWSNQPNFTKKSLFLWRKINLFDIPIDYSYFSMLLKKQEIKLLRAVTIPLLLGNIQIQDFDWKAIKNKSPKLHFSGQINHISLPQLAKSLKWQPLAGDISGKIPGVNFTEGKLSLDGGLKINVFDGEINISKLALSGLMTDFSQFHSDIKINQLDLDLLTQQFSFGGIQGRISGYFNDLYLENWQPVGFYAWLGTPEGDNSTHKISQKAVKNIASIGGGGAVDFLSRTVLSLFDNFDYDELGLGCYLHDGVCQLMGVAPADYGYYIVKGGGLPRIDVMGYNPRIDWSVLRERLQRISKSSSKAVIN